MSHQGLMVYNLPDSKPELSAAALYIVTAASTDLHLISYDEICGKVMRPRHRATKSNEPWIATSQLIISIGLTSSTRSKEMDRGFRGLPNLIAAVSSLASRRCARRPAAL